MTDKKTDTSQDDLARVKSPVLTTPASKRVPPEGPSTAAPERRRDARAFMAPAALVVALVAIGFSALLWQQHQQVRDLQARFDSQLASGASGAQRTETQVRELLTRLERQEARSAQLEQQQAESATVIRDLDEALRHMTDRGSELVLLNDVDHLATIAQQQLELGGNVRNAIVALESAQAQVVRANRPALAALLQTINGDLDRLRAASTIDIGAFSRQLEELALLLTQAPLITPDGMARQEPEQGPETIVREQPAPTIAPKTEPTGPWWERAWDATRDWSRSSLESLQADLGQFIDVRRVDDASALLMSPDQAARFRDNLRTRVMTAQLALMMRQPEIWKTETQAIVQSIESRYDESSPLTRRALRLARTMADASIDSTLPSVDNTLHAVNALREQQARVFNERDAEHETSAAPVAGAVAGGASVPAQEEPVPVQEESGSVQEEPGPAQEESTADTPVEANNSPVVDTSEVDGPSGEAGTASGAGEPASQQESSGQPTVPAGG